ncbi:hypothetical protein PT286_05965 [Neisseriaceae bacterium ESL0693]|nr:hypothetical protein [Neisseriaceae bacterium ESL0693]
MNNNKLKDLREQERVTEIEIVLQKALEDFEQMRQQQAQQTVESLKILNNEIIALRKKVDEFKNRILFLAASKSHWPRLVSSLERLSQSLKHWHIKDNKEI